jgi:hypothetical protein
MRARFLALAPILALALLPNIPADAASTPECLSRKADYVATKDSVYLEIQGMDTSTVIKLKGGTNKVRIYSAPSTVFICGGSGEDHVYDHSTRAVRFYGGKGEDKYIQQGACPGKSGDETRIHLVEYTNIYSCP